MLPLTHADLHKMYYDDESYNKGHGHAYEFLGIRPEGAIVVVRPDQCKWLAESVQEDAKIVDVSAVWGMDEYTQIGRFFEGFLIPQSRPDTTVRL